MLCSQRETPKITTSSHFAYRTFNVNTLANFWTLKAFLPGMIKEKKGHVVCQDSQRGLCRLK